jgi:AraC-like DNA-binding protein
MVRSGQRGVIDIAYDNPDRTPAGLEVVSFDALKPQVKSSVARRPSRLDFHQLMLVRGGEGTAMVDFVTYPCARGTLLHLRPGQVQRLPADAEGRLADLDAVLLLFTADFPPPLPVIGEMLDGFGPVTWSVTPDVFSAIDRAVTALDEEYRELQGRQGTEIENPVSCNADDLELTTALLRQLLAALLIRLARLSVTATSVAPSTTGADAYSAFRRDLERSFATTRSVEDFAARLGYSPRTLTRACLAATGRTAKQLVDARVTLQAQRLLAHTDLSVAAISRALGFTEATNFGKFFTRQTGRTPSEFRRTQR